MARKYAGEQRGAGSVGGAGIDTFSTTKLTIIGVILKIV
jgi:hypothetical protein